MTEHPPESEPTGVFEEGGELADLPLDQVSDLFVTLGKALRAYQLYDENNPVYKRFVSSLTEAVAGLWASTERLHVTVEEDRLRYAGQEAYRSDSRADSLAFVFYKDGVRDFTFEPGMESEVEPFLGVLQKAKNLKPEGDDLLTLLWEADFQHFKYHYVDLLAEGVDLPEAHPDSERAGLGQVLEGELEDEEDGEPPRPGDTADDADDTPQSAISKDDFNPTLYSLDPRERQILEEELEKEMRRDMRTDVLRGLFDRLENHQKPERQTEILGILRTLLPNFLSRGAVQSAAMVLDELATIRAIPGVMDDGLEAQVDRILDELSAAETLSEFLSAVRGGTIQAPPQVLSRFLRHLRADALAGLLRTSEEVEDPEFQSILRQAVRGIAESNESALIALMGQGDPIVLAGAARLAGELRITSAAPRLVKLVQHSDPGVRMAAIAATVSLNDGSSANGLTAAFSDPDRAIRIEAARAIGTLGHKPSANALKSVVTGKEIKNADLTEKMAFFEAYGRVGDHEALAVLDKFLNGKGFLGRKEPAEIRACAAMALGVLGNPQARKALEKAKDVDDPIVRNAVNKALRGDQT